MTPDGSAGSRQQDRRRRARLERRSDIVNGVDVFSLAVEPASTPATDVVLVHGLAVSNRYWRPVMRRLGTDHRVLAPDLPGVGRSSDPDRELTLLDVVDGLVVWMDAVGVERPVLVGHSLGSELVAMLAARHPERVAALVLVSPGGRTIRRPLWQQALRLLADGFRERPSMVFVAATDYLRVGTRAMLHAIGEARRWDAEDVVADIRCPTLVVQGARDLLVSPAWADRLTTLLPRASLIRIPNAPHGLPSSSPNRLTSAIRTFIRSSSVEGRRCQ